MRKTRTMFFYRAPDLTPTSVIRTPHVGSDAHPPHRNCVNMAIEDPSSINPPACSLPYTFTSNYVRYDRTVRSMPISLVVLQVSDFAYLNYQ